MHISLRAGLLLAGLTLPACGAAAATPDPAPASARDGQHDFDFELGTWHTEVQRRPPLSGASEWSRSSGTTTVKAVWGGKANLAELVAEGPAGRIEVLSLRLYDPSTQRWSLNVASSRSGEMSPPSVGRFVDGRGEFVAREQLDGREVLVRFVVSEVTVDTARFEQAFSADGGKTWEVNWIASDQRVK